MATMRNTILFLSLAFISHALRAQSAPYGLSEIFPFNRGFYAGGTFDISELDSVDTATGTLGLQIPLVSLPPGPGGMKFDLKLIYSSSLYDTEYGGSKQYLFGNSILPYNSVNIQPAGGWHYNIFYELEFDTKQPDPGSSSVSCNDAYGHYQQRVNIMFPDGTKHLLHLRGWVAPGTSTYGQGAQGSDGNGFYQVTPAGQQGPCNSGYTQVAQAPNVLVYYTDDGTFARLELVPFPPSNFAWAGATWTLHLADGTTVLGSGAQSTAIQDRNGNSITTTQTYSGSTAMVAIQDALGREITITTTSGAGTMQDTIAAPGFNTTTKNRTNLTATVNWGMVQSTDQYYSYYCLPALGNSAPCGPNEPYQNDGGINVPFTPGATVVESIQLPQAGSEVLTYTFGYSVNPGYGELNSITAPYQETTTYSYSLGSGPIRNASTSMITAGVPLNPVSARNRSYTESLISGSTYKESWSYSYFPSKTFGTSVTGPDGGITQYIACQSNITPVPEVCTIIAPNGDTTQNVWEENCPYQIWSGQPGNPYIAATFFTTGGETSEKAFSYDRNGNQVGSSEYDWTTNAVVAGSSSSYPTLVPGTLMRSVSSSYAVVTGALQNAPLAAQFCGTSPVNNVDDQNAYWNSRSDGTTLLAAKTSSISSDNRNTAGAISLVYDNAFTTGNVTSKTAYASFDGLGLALTDFSGPETMTFAYDAYGNNTSVTDANSNITVSTFNACPRAPYADTITRASGVAGISRITTQTWDCYGGGILSRTDPNGNEDVWAYDNLGRVTNFAGASGSAVESDVAVKYTEVNTATASNTPLTIQYNLDLSAKGDGLYVITDTYDQRGRREQRVTGDTTVQTLPRTFPVGGVSYEASGNPFVSASDASYGWARNTYDQNGRLTAVDYYSGNTGAGVLPPPWGAGVSLATRSVSYSANQTTDTDESGNVKNLLADGLGRLSSVVEDPSGLNYTSTYGYDYGDRLTAVTQGGQGRSFTYYADGRLKKAVAPESGSTTYTYDGVGNILTKLDANGTTTSHTYDQLNRVCTTSYAVGANIAATPSVNYYYDDIATNPGKYCGVAVSQKMTAPFIDSLVQVASTASTTSVTGVDALRRVTAGTQLTLGQLYSFSYGYNEQGSLTTQTNPSGRVLTLAYDTSNRPTSLSGSGATTSYVSGAAYWGHGAIKSMSVGPKMTETGTYDYRLRATKIAATATSPTALTLGYTWNANGNLQEETIGPNSSCTIPQYFYYDHVNRVQMSVESPTTVPAQTATACPTPTSSFTWCEQFAYDQFGNRTPTTFNLGATPLAPTAFNAATNRISSTGWAYDAGAGSGNGNITTDPSNAKMTLDGENRMVSYTPGSGAAVQYTYDGDGRRVTKDATSGAPTTYVYDAAGQLTAAYSSVANPVTGTEFLTADHLGSIRMITNSTGNAVARHDTEPFGEELLGGSTGCRLSSLGYGATSGVTLEFTGKERDAESGLDYFSARYYGSSMGRFTSPDPLPWIHWQNGNRDDQQRFESYIANPQNFNMYAYVLNNPLNKTDPTGMNACGTNNDSSCKVTVTITDRSKNANGNYNDKYAGLKGNGSYNATATVSVNGKVTGTFLADTTSSGGKFATIQNGTYDGVLHNHHGDPNKPSIELMSGGSNHIPTIAPNPAQGGASFATDVLIHPAGGTNSNPLGYTGLLPNGHGVSEACQLICSVQYQQFLGATGIRPADGSAPQQHFSVILNSSANQ